MIPFAASAQRYSEWIGTLIYGCAETPFPAVRGKERGRCMIAGDMILSVPVEGGASRLKRGDGHDLRISPHGRWQDVHLGAWRAAYGRTPYFPYLFPEIERVYREKSGGTLEEFSRALHEIALRWIGITDEGIGAVRSAMRNEPDVMSALKKEREPHIDMRYSIFHTLFRLGKESIFVLVGEKDT